MGLNMYKGVITYESVAKAFGMTSAYKPADSILATSIN
jgi:alanine dehydrogenase